jgi:hypothetical protein
MKKSIGVGLGVWMLDLFFQLASSAYPDKIKHHPYVILATGVVGLLFILYGIGSRYMERFPMEKPSHPWDNLMRDESGKVITGVAEDVSGNVAGRDNSGHQIHNAPGGTVIVGDGGRVASPEHQYLPILNIPPSPIQEPTAKLVIRTPQKVLLREDRQTFGVDSDGQPGMIVWIENPEGNVGERGARANGIATVIRFLRDGEVLGVSQRGYWLDHMEYRVDIPHGESRAVIIGLYESGLWHFFTNKRERAIPTPQNAPQLRRYYRAVSTPLQPASVPFNPTIDAQITVISERDGITLARKSYRLSTDTMDKMDFRFEELP